MHLLVVDARAGLKAAHGHLGLGTECCGDMKSPRPSPKGQLDNRGQYGALKTDRRFKNISDKGKVLRFGHLCERQSHL